MAVTDLTTQLTTLPTQPGVYLFKNSAGDILYVGKAKHLRTRVRSYFREHANLEPAKAQMVPQISHIETIVTDTENEALILEANLIRQHRPPYNVVLTDDKYYLFIKITREPLPRVFPVRRIQKDGAHYFGPYSSARAVRQTLKLLRRIFPYHAEKDSPHDQIFPHPLFDQREKSAPHSLGYRRGGVEQPLDHYKLNIRNIIRFLQGDRRDITKILQHGMQEAARQKNFERASIFRDQLLAIERLEGDQKVYLPRPESFDVISIATEKNRSAANVFSIRRGKLLNKNTFLLRHRGTAQLTDILRQFLLQYYADAQDVPSVILTPTSLPDATAISHWINQQVPPQLLVPHRGKKKQLLDMGELNAQQLLQTETVHFEQAARLERATTNLAKALGITTPLGRIETYDISNIQGQHATGSMVVFINGRPEKSQYRKFQITGLTTPNDFAMIQEVLRRRFSGRHPDWKKPDLVLIDGGKGQLSAAQKVFQELELDLPLAAIAKREEELFVPGKGDPIRLPYDDDALFLIQRMRDEAHRFVLSYHQLLRSKKTRQSLLDEIPGIGPKTKRQLLNHFGSLKGIRAATDEELIQLIGQAKTSVLRSYL